MAVITPNKTVKKDLWLSGLLDTAIEEGQSLWEDPRKFFRASSVGNKCDRCLALDMFGHRTPFDARTLRIFKVGNAIENVIIETLTKAKMLVSAQGKLEYLLPPEIPFIEGHYDAIIKTKNDAEYLLEIKSINEFDFAKLPEEHEWTMAGNSPLMKRYERYIQQWNTYSGSTHTPEMGMILFEAKNSQKHKIYYLRHDPLMLADLFYRLEAIHKQVMVGMIPARSRDISCRNYLCKKLPPEAININKVKKIDGELRG